MISDKYFRIILVSLKYHIFNMKFVPVYGWVSPDKVFQYKQQVYPSTGFTFLFNLATAP